MTKRILFLSRHGETPQSLESIVQGHSDTHLTPKGELDSILLGDHLARQQNIQTIMTSDLSRAVMTARLIAQRISPPPRIVEVAALRELACGVLEGQPFARLKDLRLRDPRGSENAAPPGGESLAALRQRVLDWYFGLVAGVNSETLIITHKGPLAVILAASAPSWPAALVRAALEHSSLVALDLNGATAAGLEVARPGK
ncbi:MAG: histidine phosphatase family protein [Deltaproteobacteria bacterium]|nr:histidine phosphatase family protein [Deltaproteobacteria bacterium]